MRRDWIIHDCKTGQILTRASSVWVMMNKLTRRLSKIPDEVRSEIEPYFMNSAPIVEEDGRKLQKLDDNTAGFVRTGLTCKNDEEIVAVLAHELGHWKLNHSVYLFISIQIRTLLHFGGYALLRNSSSLFHSLGDMQSYFVEWSSMGYNNNVLQGSTLSGSTSTNTDDRPYVYNPMKKGIREVWQD